MPPLIAHNKTSQKDKLPAQEAIQRNLSHAWKISKTITRGASTIIASGCTIFVPRGLAAGTDEERETQKKSGAAGDWLHSYGVHDAAEIEHLRRGRQAEELHARPHVSVVFYGQR